MTSIASRYHCTYLPLVWTKGFLFLYPFPFSFHFVIATVTVQSCHCSCATLDDSLFHYFECLRPLNWSIHSYRRLSAHNNPNRYQLLGSRRILNLSPYLLRTFICILQSKLQGAETPEHGPPEHGPHSQSLLHGARPYSHKPKVFNNSTGWCYRTR